MAQWYDHIDDERRRFIEQQHLFFVSTVPANRDDFPNLSPKGRNLLRVLGPNLVGYVDYYGSGDQTAAQTERDGRVTLMLCSFDATAGIVRILGRGRRVDLDDPDLARHRAAFADDLHPYVRQAFLVEVEKVQTSCGYGVPRMRYEGERDTLDRWGERNLEPREIVDGLPRPGPLRLRGQPSN